ncbi:MAG: hypothetical protein JW863_13615 [Chitinispirillaceae bacterium]|nr:hypothetical protein [Chitinispirillaceae bacterium]
MRHPSLLKGWAGVIALLLLSVSWGDSRLFADQVVDNMFDDDQNELEYYWYYLDDNAGVGPNDRPQLFPDLKPSVINVPYDSMERHAFGDTNDTWIIKKYKFQTTTSMGKPCATMPFTFGDPWKAGYCTAGECAMPFVGMGTQLIYDGGGMDIRGATHISFKIKSRVNTLNEVTVRMQTLDIDLYADKPGPQMVGDEFGYYQFTFAVEPGDWQDVLVPLNELTIPLWAHDFAFDTTICTKLSWEIKGDGIITGDTVDIADVVLVGDWSYVSPSIWPTAESASPATGFFSNFDMEPFNQGPPELPYFWYAYNDADIGGNSTVTPQYATANTATGKLDLNLMEKTGSDGVGRAAALEYVLGDPVIRDSTSIAGFVGIGINLYDSTACTYWNADAAAANAIYFEYLTDAGAKYLTFELSDSNDVGDALHPARKEKRGSGIVYYRNFPPTYGAWRKVLVPFDSLVVHDKWDGYVPITLDKTALAKAQWKVQGAKGTSGLIAIDRIFFPGGDYGQIESVSKHRRSGIRTASFDVFTDRGSIRVNWKKSVNLTRAMLSLVTINGMTVSRAKVPLHGNGSVCLTRRKLPSGIYLVRLDGTDTAGKSVGLQSTVTVIR